MELEKALQNPYGMILITGPTACGKTTTVYGALTHINDPHDNIMTVEDPVEYRLPHIIQIQVNPAAGLTFANVLRSFLRHDPDIVMIGEIRDQETALIAVESALTGHMVLSTLHTNDAPSAITRLTEMGLETFLISSAVDSIVCQRLARLLCPKCKEEYQPSLEALERIDFPLEEGENIPTLYRAKGCDHCSNTGYRGRTGIFEIMLMSDEIERLTVERANTEEIRKVAMAEGMKTLREEGLLKAKQGLTSIEEVMRVIA